MRGDAFTPVPNRGMITISIMLANIMQGLDKRSSTSPCRTFKEVSRPPSTRSPAP